jgi:hypothetical protein
MELRAMDVIIVSKIGPQLEPTCPAFDQLRINIPRFTFLVRRFSMKTVM